MRFPARSAPHGARALRRRPRSDVTWPEGMMRPTHDRSPLLIFGILLGIGLGVFVER
jgi:hypothetical protein